MRPIDADKIHYCNYDLDNYHSFRAVTDDEIDEMPTLTYEDLAPHGRWVKDLHGDTFSCSECGHKIKDNRIYNWETCPSERYCGGCGAKMDL